MSSWIDCAINNKLKILHGKCRNDAPSMNAVYAKEFIRKGELLLSWNGIMIEDTIQREPPNTLANLYDATKYIMEFQRGKKTILVMGRLDYNGNPPAIQNEDDEIQCMAYYINEPDPTYETIWNLGVDNPVFTIKKSTRNTANTCIKLYEKRGVWGPCVYATTNINAGTELTLRYDSNPSETSLDSVEYDRKHYDFDYENMTMSAVSSYESATGIDCDGVDEARFVGNMPKISKFHREIFVIPNSGTEEDKAKMELRSQIYWDEFFTAPPTIERRQSSHRRTVRIRTTEQSIEAWHSDFYGTDGLRDKKEKAIGSLRACIADKRGKKTDKTLLFKASIVTLLEELNRNAHLLCLTREEVSIGTEITVHLWLFIMRMQKLLWDSLSSIANMPSQRSVEHLTKAIDPDKIAGVNDGETAADWDDLGEEYEESKLYAQRFFNELRRIKKIINERQLVIYKNPPLNAQTLRAKDIVCRLFNSVKLEQDFGLSLSEFEDNNKSLYDKYKKCKRASDCKKKGAKLLRKSSEKSENTRAQIDGLFAYFMDNVKILQKEHVLSDMHCT